MIPLTRQRIIDAAIAIADAGGFEAVTLRRIAGELGVHVTSLYNHVSARDDITDAIVVRLVEEAGLPSTPENWEAWVRRFVKAIGEVAVRHPGAFVALQRRPVQSAAATASFEAALAAFTKVGLSAEEAYTAVKATTFVALSIGAEKALESSGQSAETNVAELPPDEFPLLYAIWAGGDLSAAAWSFSLETLVSGLRVQVRQRKSTARAR